MVHGRGSGLKQQNDPWVHCYLISIYLNSTTTKRRQGDIFKEKKP